MQCLTKRVRGALASLTVGLSIVLLALPTMAASVPESSDAIKLAKYDWTGQYITTEVAAEILRRMGYKVEIVQTTQVPSLQAISDGELTASLEWWNQANKAAYDEEMGSAKDSGRGRPPERQGGELGIDVPEFLPG